MLDYRLYFLDRADRIQGAVEFDCDADDDAIAQAGSYADGRPMELWRGDRFLGRFPEKTSAAIPPPRDRPAA